MDLLGTAGGLYVARENQQFAEEMASTQYQRGMADMRSAGLSPNAIYGSGGGSPAAAPGGQMENPVVGQLGATAKTAVDIAQGVNQAEKIGKETEVVEAAADTARANAKIAQSEAEVKQRENTAYKQSLDTWGGKTLATLNKYAGPATSFMGGAASAIGRGLGSVFGGYSSAKQAEKAPAPKGPVPTSISGGIL